MFAPFDIFFLIFHIFMLIKQHITTITYISIFFGRLLVRSTSIFQNPSFKIFADMSTIRRAEVLSCIPREAFIYISDSF